MAIKINGNRVLDYDGASYSSTNIAVGLQALNSLTTGAYNTAVGRTALYSNTTGAYNTAVGQTAGSNITTGTNNTLLGYNAQPSSATVSNEFTLGDGNISNLRCADTTISTLSDIRDKTNIQNIPVGLNYIKAVRPVMFDWNTRDRTRKGKKDFGFIAQELDQVEQQFGYDEYTRLVHKENPDKWEADPMKMFPILIRAIQELSEELETLKAKLAA